MAADGAGVSFWKAGENNLALEVGQGGGGLHNMVNAPGLPTLKWSIVFCVFHIHKKEKGDILSEQWELLYTLS